MSVGITDDITGGPRWYNAAVRPDTVLLRARCLNLTDTKSTQIINYYSTFHAVADFYDLDKAV